MTITTIGIIGAGNIGSNVARAAIKAGYEVAIANSRGPETLTELIAELGPNATAVTPEQAAEQGDIVLVAVPLGKRDELPQAQLAGKVVMDAHNYYPGRDGRIPELDSNELTTSELMQRTLPESRIVKAFNNIFAKEIPEHGEVEGTPGRRALPIAGNDEEAKGIVTTFLDDLGYDAVDLGPLSESWRVERDTSTYGVRTTAQELRDATQAQERIQQV